MEGMPNDVIGEMMKHMDPKTLIHFCKTNKNHYHLCESMHHDILHLNQLLSKIKGQVCVLIPTKDILYFNNLAQINNYLDSTINMSGEWVNYVFPIGIRYKIKKDLELIYATVKHVITLLDKEFKCFYVKDNCLNLFLI